ncbi:MAG: DUF4231 domain-containing protein [Syntrophales bacterium]|nr:DUF4231 domain-containing protein [Syntrophales bacterium]
MITDQELPGLYKAADKASLDAQRSYYLCLMLYLTLLVGAAGVSFFFGAFVAGAITSAILFLLTLGILISLRVTRPDDVWYNGRAVAESVKTRSWRWMMRTEPYEETDPTVVSKQFINDLKAILKQNRTLAGKLPTKEYMKEPISDCMNKIRAMSICERLSIYKTDRIQNQADWYSKKAIFNKKRSRLWFWISVVLHAVAIIMLLLRIRTPSLSLPVTVVATAASAVLTWLQAKKHNELSSSYSLTAHEIVLIKGEAISINSERDLSDFVLDTESAFSREHTQWVARKND